jgi:uncharacterized protein YyaL (SSP411 family)
VAAWLAACGGGSLPMREPELPPSEQPAQVSGVVAAEQAFEWQPYSRESFERAKKEGRYVLLHGSAAWCHWCHVMEETTYRDPAVTRVLRERFVAIRVDVDARPDIEERYGAWGWPATILFDPNGKEVGKFRGYIASKELLPILETIEDQSAPDGELVHTEPGPDSAPISALPWVMRRSLLDMAWFWDEDGGGWGTRQRAPLGDNAEVELRRGQRGDGEALARGKLALEKQAALMDPVWGGMYQYSTGSSWNAPHYEKLMTAQAMNLEAYAAAYRILREGFFLEQARAIEGYVERFLTSKEGSFYVSQDADVGAHDPEQEFVAGRDYYPKSSAEREKLGIPWVDEHVYAYENGLMIAALVSLHEALDVAGTSQPLTKAKRALDRVLQTHVENGSVKHDAADTATVRYLVDAAGLGRGACRVAEVTKDTEYRDVAVSIAERMDELLLDEETGAYVAHSEDPDAWGVFAEPRRPLRHNVLAARFLACLARVTGKTSYRDAAQRTLAAVATPKALDAQGRMLGGFLLALDESGIELPGDELPSEAKKPAQQSEPPPPKEGPPPKSGADKPPPAMQEGSAPAGD